MSKYTVNEIAEDRLHLKELQRISSGIQSIPSSNVRRSPQQLAQMTRLGEVRSEVDGDSEVRRVQVDSPIRLTLG